MSRLSHYLASIVIVVVLVLEKSVILALASGPWVTLPVIATTYLFRNLCVTVDQRRGK